VFASSLLLLVVGAFLGAFVSVQKSEAYAGGRTQALSETRVTMARLTRDIRQGASVVGTPSASHLVMSTYVKGVLQQVVYDATGTQLTRQVGSGAPVVLQHGLASTQAFQYSPTTAAPQVVTITLTVVPPNAPNTTVTIDSEVRLRNLEEN
jgi:hypothetical protein